MKTLSLRLPESLLEKLDAVARERGESRSALLREAIEAVLSGAVHMKHGSCLDLTKDLA
jgi:metal-responsive CopG/Arc/MetJ family transcriptional regulator